MNSSPAPLYLYNKRLRNFACGLPECAPVPGSRLIFFGRWYRMKDNSLLIPPFPDRPLNAAKVSDDYYIYVPKSTPS